MILVLVSLRGVKGHLRTFLIKYTSKSKSKENSCSSIISQMNIVLSTANLEGCVWYILRFYYLFFPKIVNFIRYMKMKDRKIIL